MSIRKYAVIEAENLALGQAGSIFIDQATTDQDAVCLNGVFVAITFIEDTVFGTLTAETAQLYPADNGTSTITFPKNNPVIPPLTNVTINPSANNIGIVRCIFPFHRVITQL